MTSEHDAPEPTEPDGRPAVGGLEDGTAAVRALLRQTRLLEQTSDAVLAWEYDGPGAPGPIVYWNAAAERLYGFPREHAVGRVSYELLRPARVDAHASATDPSGASATPSHATSHATALDEALARDGRWQGTLAHTCRDGRTVVVESVHTLVVEPDGRRVVLETNRDVTAAQRSEAAARFLAAASARLAEALDPAGALQRVAHLGLPMLGDFCAVDLVGPGGAPRRTLGVHVVPEKERLMHEYAERYTPGPGNSTSPAAIALRTGETVFLAELPDAAIHAAAVDAEHRRLIAAVGPRSLVAAPLVVQGRTLGALTFGITESGRRYDLDDRALIEAFAHRAAVTLDNARLHADERAARARVEHLQRLTAALGQALTAEAVADAIVHLAKPAVGAALAVIVRLSADGQELHLLEASSVEADVHAAWARYPVSTNSPLAESVRTRQAIAVAGRAALEARFPSRRDLLVERWRAESFFAAPMVIADRVLGAFGLIWTERYTFDADAIAFLQGVADQGAQALDRARLLDGERAARMELEHANELLRDQAVELETTVTELAEQSAAASDALSVAECARDEAAALSVALEQVNRELVAVAATAEAANRAKSDFLRVMSHELRTPLNAIAGYAQLLDMGLYGAVTDAQREQLGRIQRAQHHLLQLIDGVLAFARIETGHLQIRLQDVDLGATLGDLETLIAPQVRDRRLRLEWQGGPAVPVRADPDRLRQVVLNLLANAVKFTPPGGRIELWWDAAGDGPAPATAGIHVRDTGCGIAADKLVAIFAPFVQVETGLTRTHEGTGLGLAISREFARAMGGDVTVASTVGEGSTFTVRLPLGGPSRASRGTPIVD